MISPSGNKTPRCFCSVFQRLKRISRIGKKKTQLNLSIDYRRDFCSRSEVSQHDPSIFSLHLHYAERKMPSSVLANWDAVDTKEILENCWLLREQVAKNLDKLENKSTKLEDESDVRSQKATRRASRRKWPHT